jgi:pimeloyl-ACP methyl ester carboxylesterase
MMLARSQTAVTSTLVLVLVLWLSAGVLAAGCDLKSRGFAGFAYRDLTRSDRDSLALGDSSGVMLSQILSGTPADAAGLKAGDIITAYGGHALVDGSQLAGVTRQYFAGDTVSVSFLRDGKPLALQLVLAGVPREASTEVETEYTCFESRGNRLRAVVTSPPSSSGERLPAMLLVSALGSPRLTGTASYSMGRAIAYAAAAAGFRVLRFELAGYGDSEGRDYRESDFDTEVADNLAALDYLAGRLDVEPRRVFVMGHSTGGMVAAILAARRETAGLVTSCTIGRTFYERSLETLRLQSEFGGDTPDVTDTKIKEYLELMTSAARGDSLAGIIRRNAALAKYVNNSGRIMDDRTVDYWRQQLNLNLPEIYGEVTEPVLVVYAASDFLTQLACHEAIRDVLVNAGNGDVTLAVVPGTDHGYTVARDKREAYDNYRKSDRTPNPEPLRRITEWLEARKAP